jgi:hypothetical protein
MSRWTRSPVGTLSGVQSSDSLESVAMVRLRTVGAAAFLVLALLLMPAVDAGAGASLHSISAATWGATTQAPCEGLDASLCMSPFPSDYYTVSDPTTSGLRVSFPSGAFPPSAAGTVFDPTPWESNDGFSPGSTILTHVPGLELGASHVASISDIGDSLASDSPVVLIDARTGARWPTWSELDASDPNAATRLLLIHPARNLTEGDRYLVALRDLKTSDGSSIAPSTAFAAVLDSPTAPPAGLSASYEAHLRGVVQQLGRAGVRRAGLYLAWDFTVASTRSITAPALAMRNQTFAAIGHGVGSYTVTQDIVDPKGQPDLARIVIGTFDVPSYLSATPGTTSAVLTAGSNGLPESVGASVDHANFECEIPRAATAAHAASIGIYGHGLFNSADEVTQSAVPQYANAYDYVFCGTDWLGLSSSTLPLAVSVINDINRFPALVDNLLQALLNAQVLGNLLDSPKGFSTNPAFQDAQHRPLIRASGLVYYGNSEGGIMGGVFTAVSTEVHRSVLGVPGQDYAVLLPRSADFSPFQSALNQTYPDRAVQLLAFDVMQLLWDRADADGYAEQMTNGLPGTPSHQVLLEEAFGDHQVANVTTETEARTIGAHIHDPALASGRSNEKEPYWDLPALSSSWNGPALFVWDTGVPPAPLSDTPPTQGPDPHDTTPRTFKSFWAQMHTFFSTGKITNPCGGQPCKGPYPSGGS